MELQAGQHTDRGPRTNNQDSVRVNAALGYAVVADGMGGARGGADASGMAIQLADWLLARDLPEARRTHTVPQLLTRLFVDANRWILQKSNETPELQGMGTTLVVLILADSRGYVGHAGDSRAYRLRGTRFEQLTRDHSLVQARVDAGIIQPEEANHQLDRNVITRAVGVEPQLEPEVSEFELADGDTFVLTTDGVHGVVPRDRLRELIVGQPQSIAENLVREALSRNTTDNSTAAVLRASGDGLAPKPDEPDPAALHRPPSWFQRLFGR